MRIRNSDNQRVIIDDTDLEEVEKFIYLGCEIRKEGGVKNKVGVRIRKAGTAFKMLDEVLNANIVSLSTKLKLFNSIVISVLI